MEGSGESPGWDLGALGPLGGRQWELGTLGKAFTGFVVGNWELVAQLVAGAVLTTGVGVSFGTSKP